MSRNRTGPSVRTIGGWPPPPVSDTERACTVQVIQAFGRWRWRHTLIRPDRNGRISSLPDRRLMTPYEIVNVPVFIGAGAVSVNVLDVAVFSPNKAKPVPEAAMAVVAPEVLIVPVPLAVTVTIGPGEYWV
jgi:hypothetical protein